MSDRVRRGIQDVPKERLIHIDSIQMNAFQSGIFPEVSVEVMCQSGTYIRSLCNDLSRSLSKNKQFV